MSILVKTLFATLTVLYKQYSVKLVADYLMIYKLFPITVPPPKKKKKIWLCIV